MNAKLFAKSILIALMAVMTGCSNNDVPENELSESDELRLVRKTLANVPEDVNDKESIPVWLSEFIDSLKPDNARNVVAFQAKWKGQVVYYVYDDYFSCLMCTTFMSDGERFDWTVVDPEEFWETATDWKCIYLSKLKVQE